MASEDLIRLYQAHLRERECTDATIRTFTRTLRVVDRDLPYGLDLANEEELRAWIWRDGLTAASRNCYYSAIHGFFAWAVEHAGVLDFDPTRRIARPKVPPRMPRVAADEHVAAVLAKTADPYLLWAKIAAYAGARCIEIFRMRREHITPQRTIIPRGKGDKPRAVPTHPIVWTAVQTLPGGPIVTTHDHENEMSRDFIGHCQRRIGVRGISLHRLRGWWATKMYKQTKDLRAVQQGLGHANPRETAGYIDIEDTELFALVRGLPTFG
ncbi:MAG TPA: tyrosine-type recombinase/integrase [Candidatus Limnocylindrales bacterium]|nr:tyrosine-type recombinase/integrase [Candidatus Limnocylindrales bacterium]